VDPRVKSQNRPKSKPPILILFGNQRKIPKFPQNIFLQLVTLFSVYLRVLPFSEVQPKTRKPKNLSNFRSIPSNLAHSRRPIIKGLRPDLIFYRYPLNVTHILIYFFIQYSFSHKFLKPY
jgi:hypothetical protein